MKTDTDALLAKLEKTSNEIRRRDSQIHGLDSEREATIRAARLAGASWGQIGKALGVTKQSAWERYRHIDPPSPSVAS